VGAPEPSGSGAPTAVTGSVVAGELLGDLVGLVLDLLGALLQRRRGLVALPLVLQVFIARGGTGRLLGAALELFSLVLELVLRTHQHVLSLGDVLPSGVAQLGSSRPSSAQRLTFDETDDRGDDEEHRTDHQEPQ